MLNQTKGDYNEISVHLLSEPLSTMKIITHKFKNHQVKADTETLIIGTFNPDSTDNPADFFYGRGRNYLWKLLPTAFERESLKDKSIEDKLNFLNNYKIDFIDLIESVEVDDGQETNYDDGYLDKRKIKWVNIISILANLKNLKKVCFTRKTMSDIPNMKQRIIEIENYCKSKNVAFTFLVTPARFYNINKQRVWNNFFKQ